MTHSNITTSNSFSNQQQSNIAKTSNSEIQSSSKELIFNGDRVYLAVKNKIKNSPPQENNNDYANEISLIPN